MRKHKMLLPEETARIIQELGMNIELARKRRRLPIETICSRTGITRQTFRRLTNGDPGISIGILASVLTAMNLEHDIELLANPSRDHVGITLERTHQPKRISTSTRDELDTDF